MENSATVEHGISGKTFGSMLVRIHLKGIFGKREKSFESKNIQNIKIKKRKKIFDNVMLRDRNQVEYHCCHF